MGKHPASRFLLKFKNCYFFIQIFLTLKKIRVGIGCFASIKWEFFPVKFPGWGKILIRITGYMKPGPVVIMFVVLLCMLLSVRTLHALTPVIIDENTESVSLGKYMEILEDPFSINLLNPLRGLYVY